MTDHDGRALAVAFLREFAIRTAGRVERLPFGVAVFNDELPSVWDLNIAWVDTVPPNLSAEGLADELERLQGGARLARLHAQVTDEAGGERLAPGLAALGWSTKRYVLMIHRRSPDRGSGPSLVREVDEATMRAFSEDGLRRDPARFDEETIAQIAGQKSVVAAAGGRFFVAEVDGIVASGCDLYGDGQVGQIEAVLTLESYRNRGLGRAVVLRALTEARSAGYGVVFLLAEEDDWPRQLYDKLGFDEAGFVHVFMRKPA